MAATVIVDAKANPWLLVNEGDGLFPTQVNLPAGSALTFLSDGVVEAENAAGQELGDGPLADVVLRRPDAGVEELFEALLVEAFRHLEEGKFRDDVTLVVIKRMG